MITKPVAHRRWKYFRPTFNGKHNELKAKCLLILYETYLADPYGNGRWLTSRQIHELSGVNYRSLLTRLPLYHKWKLVLVTRRKYGFIHSCISKRGRDYLERYKDTMPLARYLSDIETWQAEVRNESP